MFINRTSRIKGNKVLIYAVIGMNFTGIMVSQKSQKQKDKHYNESTYPEVAIVGKFI
jgi:hypothetical protein